MVWEGHGVRSRGKTRVETGLAPSQTAEQLDLLMFSERALRVGLPARRTLDKDESVDLIACVARAPSPGSVGPKAQSISSAMSQFRKPRCCSELTAIENTLHQALSDQGRLHRPKARGLRWRRYQREAEGAEKKGHLSLSFDPYPSTSPT
jgi:hypothetical protein